MANSGIQIDRNSVKAARRELQKLPPGIAKDKAILQAMMRASLPLRQSIRQAASGTRFFRNPGQSRPIAGRGYTPRLGKTIGTKTEKGGDLGQSLLIGAKNTRGKFSGFHGPMLEGGTVVRKTKTGQNRGKITAIPWFSRTWNENVAAVSRDLLAKLSLVIQRHIDKKAKY